MATVRISRLAGLALALATFASAAMAQSASKPEWLGVWGFPPVVVTPTPPAAPPPVPVTPAPPVQISVAPSAVAPQSDLTVRQELFASSAASALRLRISNEAGSRPVRIGAVRLVLLDAAGAVKPGSERIVTFGGAAEAVAPANAPLLTDPIPVQVAAFERIVVSIYFPQASTQPYHRLWLKVAAGDATVVWPMVGEKYLRHGAPVTLVEAKPVEARRVIVALGDSITEGITALNVYASWPRRLGERLAATQSGRQLAVVNAGISGNRVLREGTGQSALARFDRDVLSVPGVSEVILLEGINDIGAYQRTGAEADAVTAAELITAYRQIIDRAHAHGLKIHGATLTPYEGAAYYGETGEAMRQAVNAWIRTSGAFDGVIDFEAAIRDPANPRRIRPDLDLGDHLHPNPAGYAVMGDAIDLTLFGVR